MKRAHQILFAVSFLLLNWLAMMAVHELGHATAALLSGGEVQQVVLHPLAISRTDVAPNPQPGLVVWLGPIVGCLLPLLLWAVVPRRLVSARNMTQFFAGFCLLANGAYIAIGSFDRVGDCREMLRTGSPLWVLWAFGAATIPLGFYMWHRLGSLSDFFNNPRAVTPRLAYTVTVVLLAVLVVEVILSGR